jgi:hypothetical protein
MYSEKNEKMYERERRGEERKRLRGGPREKRKWKGNGNLGRKSATGPRVVSCPIQNLRFSRDLLEIERERGAVLCVFAAQFLSTVHLPLCPSSLVPRPFVHFHPAEVDRLVFAKESSAYP